jgi:hypothetical protein
MRLNVRKSRRQRGDQLPNGVAFEGHFPLTVGEGA